MHEAKPAENAPREHPVDEAVKASEHHRPHPTQNALSRCRRTP
jgi:hypothetical protein